MPGAMEPPIIEAQLGTIIAKVTAYGGIRQLTCDEYICGEH